MLMEPGWGQAWALAKEMAMVLTLVPAWALAKELAMAMAMVLTLVPAWALAKELAMAKVSAPRSAQGSVLATAMVLESSMGEELVHLRAKVSVSLMEEGSGVLRAMETVLAMEVMLEMA
jgi:hypothetical protein